MILKLRGITLFLKLALHSWHHVLLGYYYDGLGYTYGAGWLGCLRWFTAVLWVAWLRSLSSFLWWQMSTLQMLLRNRWTHSAIGFERVTGRKAWGLQMEEIAFKCQTFLSLLSGRRKQTSNIFFPSLYKFKRRFLLKYCVAIKTPGFTWS